MPLLPSGRNSSAPVAEALLLGNVWMINTGAVRGDKMGASLPASSQSLGYTAFLSAMRARLWRNGQRRLPMKGVHAMVAGFVDAVLQKRAPMKTVYTKGEAECAPLQAGRQSALLLEHGELELRYYAPRGRDSQTPHDRDEVYFVASGSGVIFCSGRREAFQTGDSIFVPAHAEHFFESFTDDFAVWVVFYGPVVGSGSSKRSADPTRQADPPKHHYDPPAKDADLSAGQEYDGGDFGGK